MLSKVARSGYYYYYCSTRVISEIFDVHSQPRVNQGTIRQTGYGFLLVFYSNNILKTHRFSDIRIQKCRDLENRVRGSVKVIGNFTI